MPRRPTAALVDKAKGPQFAAGRPFISGELSRPKSQGENSHNWKTEGNEAAGDCAERLKMVARSDIKQGKVRRNELAGLSTPAQAYKLHALAGSFAVLNLKKCPISLTFAALKIR